jgi:hypothetical protein
MSRGFSSNQHDGVASTKNLTIMILTSEDPTALGDARSFSHNIRPFRVDDPENYEVALVSIDYPAPPAATAVFIGLNFVGFGRVGSQLTNTLYRLPSRVGVIDAHFVQDQSIVEWRPLAGSEFSVAEVALTDPTGALVFKYDAAFFPKTIVTIAIRRIDRSF